MHILKDVAEDFERFVRYNRFSHDIFVFWGRNGEKRSTWNCHCTDAASLASRLAGNVPTAQHSVDLFPLSRHLPAAGCHYFQDALAAWTSSSNKNATRFPGSICGGARRCLHNGISSYGRTGNRETDRAGSIDST